MDFLPIKKDGNKVYAGFWKRSGAAFIDFLLIYTPLTIIMAILKGISIGIAVIAVVIWATLLAMYPVYFHYRWGATVGKLARDIKVTLPNGSAIGFREAVLRSSVDLIGQLFVLIAQVTAMLKAGPEQYLSAGWWGSGLFYPAWYGAVNTGKEVWYWSELVVLLFNKRKRGFNDFIAGTVVIHQQYAEQGAQADAVDTPPVS